jgi:oligopeptidase B
MSIAKPRMAAPRAARHVSLQVHHGVALEDPYAWLRDDDWQEAIDDPGLIDPPIRQHLEAENAYTAAALAGLADLRRTLSEEMRGRVAQEDEDVPEVDGPWAYFECFTHGAEHQRLCRAPAAGGSTQLLLDCDAAARGKPFWSIEEAIHSPDHALLAYTYDPKGSERCNLRIRDLAAGRNLDERMSGVAGDVAWSLDSRSLFYVRLDRQQRPMEVWRHEIGTHVQADKLVFKERDPTFEVSVGVTQSGRYVLIETHAHDVSEIWLLDAADVHAPLVCVSPRRTGHAYIVDHFERAGTDRLVVLTNSAGAEDYRICEAAPGEHDPACWQEIVAHRPGRRIVDMTAYARHLVRLERADGQPQMVVRRWADGAEHIVTFDEEAYDLQLEEGLQFDTNVTRFVYSSMTTPEETFDYDMEERTRALRKRRAIPTGHDPANYVTRRLHARAADGEEVPISLLHRRGTPLDGSAPLFLNAYGAYGVPTDAEFSQVRLSLVDRGFVYAIAHVRGGEDKGQRWYDGGKLRNKRNTFTDFIAVASHLVAQGYTRRGRIVAHGESAGGMLMGAVANMAPDLFLAMIADVPFVDVLNTMLDDTLPMTPAEWPEWGNPLESKADFELIRSYCPYQNVARQPYPHILANASLADLRVGYWEPAKWVARLRELSTSDSLVLLNTNMTAGHGGSSGRFQKLDDFAFDYAFAIAVAGLARLPPR